MKFVFPGSRTSEVAGFVYYNALCHIYKQTPKTLILIINLIKYDFSLYKQCKQVELNTASQKHNHVKWQSRTPKYANIAGRSWLLTKHNVNNTVPYQASFALNTVPRQVILD